MVLRLRVKICRGGKCVEGVGIANSGFAGDEPEITLPRALARELLGEGLSLTLVERVLADGSRVALARTTERLDVYLVAEGEVRGPVRARAYVVGGQLILLNDCLLSALRVVIIDPRDGIWCFREELGRRERRGV